MTGLGALTGTDLAAQRHRTDPTRRVLLVTDGLLSATFALENLDRAGCRRVDVISAAELTSDRVPLEDACVVVDTARSRTREEQALLTHLLRRAQEVISVSAAPSRALGHGDAPHDGGPTFAAAGDFLARYRPVTPRKPTSSAPVKPGDERPCG